ncbi:glycosyltransferase family 2 protein [Candidatus Saccharibacteria bacterium]|nr:glycosyltransferase family 2 protein [Candidatus Saccharibacteria bacterium]
MNKSKKVSVILPNYNYEKYLSRRIKSILSQTYPLYELIILDDASSDNSVKKIKSLLPKIKEKYPNLKVKFLVNEKNTGKPIKQWQKGFELATGNYIWIAEADDLSSRRFLEEMMKPFSDEKVVLSYSESKIINKFGVILAPNFRFSRDKEKTGRYQKSYIKDGKKEIEEIMAIRCSIPNVSAVVFYNTPKIPYQKYLEEASSFSQAGDWYFYSKVLNHGKISYNKKSLNSFRVHHGSRTAESKKLETSYREILKLHQSFLENYHLSEVVKKWMKAEEMRIKLKYGIIS